MAITNAQQYQQLVNKPANGKRPGYRGDAAYRSASEQSTSIGQGNVGSTESFGGGQASDGSEGAGAINTSQYTTPTQDENNAAAIAKGKAEQAAKEKRKTIKEKIAEYNKNYKKKQLNRYQRSKIDLLNKNLQELEPGLFYGDTEETYQDFIDRYAPSLTEFGPKGTKKYSQQFLDDVASGKRPPPKSTLDTGIPSIDFINNTINDVPITKEYLTDLYSGDKNSYTRARDFDIDSATGKEMMEEFEPNRFKLENNDGGGDNNQQQTDPCLGPNPPAYCNVGGDTEEEDATPPRNLGGLAPRFAGSIFDFDGMADGGRAGAMDGGRMMMMNQEEDDPVGGIMDLETSRQMYGLGKLVKKITRGVKKVAKSPVGKAALMYFGGKALMGGMKGSSLFGKGPGSAFVKMFGANNTMPGFGNVSTAGMGGLFEKLGLVKGYGSMMPTIKGGIALASTLPLLMGQKEEEENNDDYYKTQGINIADIRNNPYKFMAPRFAADGGIMRNGYAEGSEEPVAKKTMPLLDMDGQEMDLREEGGFVPLGRMERADDVPARLSKNEFVFTADAVRNAGEGDVDKGAEVMYNMMKNLESGGDVSEESQGLEGAREMFQTSQRLEEVI